MTLTHFLIQKNTLLDSTFAHEYGRNATCQYVRKATLCRLNTFKALLHSL